MDIEVALKTINGKEVPAVTSLQVAEAFGKDHRNVLRDIRETIAKCSESFSALNFELAKMLVIRVDGAHKVSVFLPNRPRYVSAVRYNLPAVLREL